MPDLINFIKSILEQEKLAIVDVGATGGPQLQWKKWSDLCFFYTFDPDPRMTPWEGNCKNFPAGLWSYPCEQMLHLAAYPPSSSLFLPNQDFLNAFSTHSALEKVGSRTIELDTLDHLLEGQVVDFIKIDAEGAELEILKGSSYTLQTGCLGLQLEALFNEIRHNAPTFSELDSFVRNYDFQLFHIQREHWIRKNQISTFDSTPQLIWGDVLYLLSKKAFLKRLKQTNEPRILFGKYLLILLAYHLYDYAYEICDEVDLEVAKQAKSLLSSLKVSKSALIPLVFSLLIGSGKYLLAFSKKSKQHRLNYLHRKIRELGRACLYLGKNNFALYD